MKSLNEKMLDLRRIGTQMSNVCYNLSQDTVRELTANDKAVLGDLVRQWDAAERAAFPARLRTASIS